MEDTQISNQDHEQKVQNVLDEINKNKNVQLTLLFGNLNFKLFSTKQVNDIAEAIKKAGLEFDRISLGYFFGVCEKEILDANCVKTILQITKNFKFDITILPEFLNVCGKNSLDNENLIIVDRLCDENLFSFSNVNLIRRALKTELAKNFFQNLCEFHEKEKEREILRKELSERKAKNKTLGILGSIGVTIGLLIFLGAISFLISWEIGLLALAAAVVVKIAAPVTAVSLVLIFFFTYCIDKFKADKKTIELEEEQLEQSKAKEQDNYEVNEVENNLDDYSDEPFKENNEDKGKE